jgi:hypothetical protein
MGSGVLTVGHDQISYHRSLSGDGNLRWHANGPAAKTI